MKNIFSLALAMLFSIGVFGQVDAIEKFFNDYSNNEEFTVVYVSPKMFQMVSKASSGSNDPELAAIVKDLKGLRILSTEKNAVKYYKDANARLNLKGYEELMTVKEKNQNVRFVTKEANGVISELLLLVGGPDQFTMMSFVGNIDLDKIAKLSKKLDIDGAEHLEKAAKNKK